MSYDPPLDVYIASEDELGFAFAYPPEYASSIEPIQRAVREADIGLGVWFLSRPEVIRMSNIAAETFLRRLVAFARIDNGDWICYFDADHKDEILLRNLGERKPMLSSQKVTYLEFIRDVLRGFEIPCPELESASPAPEPTDGEV